MQLPVFCHYGPGLILSASPVPLCCPLLHTLLALANGSSLYLEVEGVELYDSEANFNFPRIIVVNKDL